MEEVDSILLSQLREIGCDFEEKIEGISSLDTYQVMQCVAVCLRRILSESSLIPNAHAISPALNMSIKYKYATQFAQAIQDLGYKSDIGYQTFLYSSEHDIRRLLLFLVERISREEDEKAFEGRENNLSSRVITGGVLQRLHQMNLSTIWIPHNSSPIELDYQEDMQESESYSLHDNVINWSTVHAAANVKFGFKQFLNKTLAKQQRRYAQMEFGSLSIMQPTRLLPERLVDILEWNHHFWRDDQLIEDEEDSRDSEYLDKYFVYCKNKNRFPISYKRNLVKQGNIENIPKPSRDQANLAGTPDDNVKILEQTRTSREELNELALEHLRKQLQKFEHKLTSIKQCEVELEQKEFEYQDKCRLLEASCKTKDELQNGVTMLKGQIEEINSTWEEIQSDLLATLKAKKSHTSAKNDEYRDKIRQISQLKKSIGVKLKEIQSKEALAGELEAKIPQQWPLGRISYTRRILEIIGNVKKQNEETKKVLLETKSIQKDINVFNGKIERSFAVAEEVIFREAKQNEWHRRCYKSLALLQSTFAELLQAISTIGAHLREVRQLEEMIDGELTRKTASNLERINADLWQIKLENQQLQEKLKDRGISLTELDP